MREKRPIGARAAVSQQGPLGAAGAEWAAHDWSQERSMPSSVAAPFRGAAAGRPPPHIAWLSIAFINDKKKLEMQLRSRPACCAGQVLGARGGARRVARRSAAARVPSQLAFDAVPIDTRTLALEVACKSSEAPSLRRSS